MHATFSWRDPCKAKVAPETGFRIMTDTAKIQKIAVVGDYLPRKCGIATFTHSLYQALVEQYPETECFVAPVNDTHEGYEYPPEVRFEFSENDLSSYQRTAEYLNFSNVDVISLQHEFGLFGGSAGSFVLALLRDLRIPVVTTLHTILDKPDPQQRRVLREIDALSARLVVMTERGRRLLTEHYGIHQDKIDVIAHGIPDLPFVDPNFYKDQFGVEGKQVLLTFGLLSPNKGIETALRALPEIVKAFPDLVYIILGATHPNLMREHGETYRLGLERLAQELGIKRNVSFYNRFVELDELKEFLSAADIYITPYLNVAQITSGTLAYAFGCGKAVISTPYWHAEELLADDRGVLVPFGDSQALAREVIGLLKDDTRRHAMRKRAYLLGREMVWSRVAEQYMESFDRARRARHTTARRLGVRTLDEKRLELPMLRMDHVLRMSDATGMFQHAVCSFPSYEHGYCTDDNARALIASVLFDETEREAPGLTRVEEVYASFLHYAFDPEKKRFRNFMSFDRRWLEETGSEDSQGRAIWALGTCVGRSQNRELQSWAAHLFENALPPLLETSSPRTWAYTLLGIYEYFRRLSGDRVAAQARDVLTQRLTDLFDLHSADDWPWFEPVLSYANARLPQVLILSGQWMNNPRASEIGLRSLRWLCEQQTAPAGHFRPIGSSGFYPRGGKRAEFDQQPIEAHATVSACLQAYRSTHDTYWYERARTAFEWFLGRNDLGLPLYNSITGGCCDGLHVDRVNQNQGAESTLSYVIALTEMELIENELRVFEKPAELEILKNA
jgi:glycosyltransferase involved in cell wall biosynthesis